MFVGVVVVVVVVARVVAKVVTNHGRVAIILNERKANWPIKTSNGHTNNHKPLEQQEDDDQPKKKKSGRLDSETQKT